MRLDSYTLGTYTLSYCTTITPKEVCEAADVRKIYTKSQSGQIKYSTTK